jgi:hypothetical protein
MKRFKLKNLDIDRVDLVDRGANQYADIVIHKGYDARAVIAKNMKQGYPEDTQLKNGPPPVKRTGIAPMPKDVDEKKKKKKGAKGSAFPERNAAESSTSAGSAPVEKHEPGGQSHNQQNHGKAGSGGGRKKPLSTKAKAKYKQAFGAANKAMKAKMAEGLSERDAQSAVIGHLRRNVPGVGSVDRVGGFGDDDIDQAQFEQDALPDGPLTIGPTPPSQAEFDRVRAENPGLNRQQIHEEIDIQANKKAKNNPPGVGRADSGHASTFGEWLQQPDPDQKDKNRQTHLDNIKSGKIVPRKEKNRGKGKVRHGSFPGDLRVLKADIASRIKKHTPGGKGHNQQNHAGGRGGASRPPVGLTGRDKGQFDSPPRRPLSSIASEIRSDWKKVNFAAVPYLDAMSQMGSIHEPFFYDSGSSVVAYFLSNARTWKGDTARKVKAELNEMLKDRPPLSKAFPPTKSGKELPKLKDVLGKPTDTKSAVPSGTPAPGKSEAGPTAPGQADPSQTPTEGALAPDELVPDSPPKSDGGPPLGPGTPGGERPVETPKGKIPPPKATGLPAAKPGVPPPPNKKKERIATDIKAKGKPPSGKPFA